ncbi:MAG: tRNA 2-thiouridine(34) synthase MnmA [Candidatus Krumholzibacteria bacterium]|nr:tRNA 2-thiouridine(34) synthase MnmA [Candidatus Krumholzibacteria bacterium]
MRKSDTSRFGVEPPARPGEGVVLGMSGGVDSSTAALLLRDAGYAVVGVTFRFHCGGCGGRGLAEDPNVARARSVCRALGIEHMAVDASAPFGEKVVESFVGEYRRGRTPNPCVVCNETVKFPSLASVADSIGAAMIATGHYARASRDASGKVWLEKGADPSKDQSYFLYRVPVSLLERCLFPLGGTTKQEVRKAASAAGLFQRAGTRGGAETGGRESQDVCFIPDGDLAGFLSSRIGPVPGEVVDESGRVIGSHEGVHRYTVGQRRGLGISGAVPMFVRSIDPAANRIVLAENDRLFSGSASCFRLRMRVRRPAPPLKAKIRFRHNPAEVARIDVEGGACTVVFAERQRAVTPGQSLVLFDGARVVGGGIITGSGTDG